MMFVEVLLPCRHLGDTPCDDWRDTRSRFIVRRYSLLELDTRSRGSDLQINNTEELLTRLTNFPANFEGGEASSPQPQHSV